MRNESKARVTLDLSPINKGITECDAYLASNSLDEPETLTVMIEGLEPQQINQFCEPTISVSRIFGCPNVTGVTQSGDLFECELVFIRNVSFGAASVQLLCYLGQITWNPGISANEKGLWIFGLANYRVHIGDNRTDLPIPTSCQITPEKLDQINAMAAEWNEAYAGEAHPPLPPVTIEGLTPHGGWRNNRVTFSFAGREWTLDDELLGKWPKEASKIAKPVLSGRLATKYQDGDSEVVLKQAAEDISDLLSLALGKDIKWVQFGFQPESGSLQATHFHKPGLLAFNQYGPCLADNWEFGNLKHFVECGEKVLVAERDWWSVTIGLLTQARGAKYLEVKCSLLNTLLDRITTNIIGPATNTEIEAGLKKKLDAKEFRDDLHAILSKLSSNWNVDRTREICRTINDWNARPSFPKKIIRSCEKLGIPPISGKRLVFRHVLIHEGEMHSDLESTEDRAQYFFEIEMIVLLLLVRMLAFDGQIYLQSNPPDPKRVCELLSESP